MGCVPLSPHLQPEMSHNVQKYDKQVYLRVSEAQRCRVHSTLMVPIFGWDSRDTPFAVFELVQGDKDVTFPAVLSQLTASLQVRSGFCHVKAMSSSSCLT